MTKRQTYDARQQCDEVAAHEPFGVANHGASPLRELSCEARAERRRAAGHAPNPVGVVIAGTDPVAIDVEG